jgi:peroxiredoxin
MTPSSHSKPISITGLSVIVLVTVLLGGALLVRLVNVREPLSVGDDRLTSATGRSDRPDDFAAGGMRNSDASAIEGLPRKGYMAPDFTLENLDGSAVRLSEWRGKPVLINFWATWCGPCEVEMPAIEAIYTAQRETGFVVLAIAVDDSAENVQRFAEKHGLSFQPLLDDGMVARDYLVFGLPTSFFVGVDGTITDVHTGMLTEKEIEEYLARAVSQDG